MNDQISWDPSLVKKFSSSNHYKLLNQLKNEVKKYPLNNKNKTSSIHSIETNQDSKSKENISHSQKDLLSQNPNHSNELNNNKSTVSFNNAKNFSIYKNNNITQQKDNFMSYPSKSNNNISSPTFKDRLNQIDMK